MKKKARRQKDPGAQAFRVAMALFGAFAEEEVKADPDLQREIVASIKKTGFSSREIAESAKFFFGNVADVLAGVFAKPVPTGYEREPRQKEHRLPDEPEYRMPGAMRPRTR